ncbi:MAG: hypothetical protein WDN30_03955 [Pararobbsia sp.]
MGAVVGAAIGAAIVSVLHASSLVFVIAAALGAYIGSLVGAMGGTRGRQAERAAPVARDEAAQPVREAGVLLAVHVIAETQARAEDALREAGAQDIERASGRWQGGKWSDFDPLSAPAH